MTLYNIHVISQKNADLAVTGFVSVMRYISCSLVCFKVQDKHKLCKTGHICQRMLLHTMKGSKAVPCLDQTEMDPTFFTFYV